jgi:uncharacterized OsmC-like protein
MPTTTLRNGVNVSDLMTAIEAVKTDPTNGKLTFNVRSKWLGGFRAEHTAGDYVVGKEGSKHGKAHTVSTDEPREILGGDTGMSPAEMILGALASCLAVGYAANAAAMEIDLDALSFEVTGHGSLEGFMNIGDTRPGLSDIKVKTHIKSSAPAAKLRELHTYVNEHSPVWDTICNPVNVTSEIVTG